MYINIIIIYYVNVKIFTFLNILQLFELVLVECEIILMCVLKGNKVSIESRSITHLNRSIEIY